MSSHLSLEEYAALPIRERAEYQAAAKQKREAMLAANPFSGGGEAES